MPSFVLGFILINLCIHFSLSLSLSYVERERQRSNSSDIIYQWRGRSPSDSRSSHYQRPSQFDIAQCGRFICLLRSVPHHHHPSCSDAAPPRRHDIRTSAIRRHADVRPAAKFTQHRTPYSSESRKRIARQTAGIDDLIKRN